MRGCTGSGKGKSKRFELYFAGGHCNNAGMKYNKAVYYGTVGLIAGGMLKNSRKREDFAMKRIGQVIKVKPEYLEKYKTLHAQSVAGGQ